MPTYIQSFEDAPWCVNNTPRHVAAGEVVAFDHGWEAEHFVKLGRAGLIGDFGNEEQALKELARLVAENEAQRSATKPEPETAVNERETKAVMTEGMETSAPADTAHVEAPKPATKAKKGK